MWYKNQQSRINYVSKIPEQRPPVEFFKDIYKNYVAIKESVSKTKNKVTCTKCGFSTEIKKNAKYYNCTCGYHQNKFKNKRYKNQHDRYITASAHNYNGYEVVDYYLTYYILNQNTKIIDITTKLIAKEIYIEEKKRLYHYNFGYQQLMSYYQQPVYSYRENVTESVVGYYSKLFVQNEYFSKELFDSEKFEYSVEFKYIDTSDISLLGYDVELLKRNAYLIEILQKFDSMYLFNDLMDSCNKSNKLIDLFDMRDSGLSNKQVTKIIKYFSRYKNLKIRLYKDYIDDLRFFNYKLNDRNLCNWDYEELHGQYTQKRKDIVTKELDIFIEKAYSKYQETSRNGIYIMHPHSHEDLIIEGKALNHCVGTNGYDKKIATGKSLIFFIRKDPKQPLITAEVKNGEIKQFYGKDNLLEGISPVFISKAKQELLSLVN